MPRISMVIPVWNEQSHLRECLDSVVHQTLEDIEILCIDDASTDDSPAILGDYARQDSRIRLIRHAEHQGVSQGRKAGALSARGEYLLFLDAGDRLERNAGAVLYDQIREARVEMLHFNSALLDADQVPEPRQAAIRKFTRPFPGRIVGPGEVLRAGFRDARFGCALRNKLYAAELCRKAFPFIPDGPFPAGSDLLAFFILARFARSYLGVPDICVHHVRAADGTGSRTGRTLEQFAADCTRVRVSRAIRRFLEERGEADVFSAERDRARQDLLGDCIRIWQTGLTPADRPGGFDLLVKSWGALDAVSGLARQAWYRRTDVARSVRGANALACRKAPVQTIGVYYHRLFNGGVERAVSNLIPLWKSAGYDVVLLTDLPPAPEDFALPAGVKRVVLPSWRETHADNFHPRGLAWQQALADNGIDIVVYHAWVSALLLWDLLAVKSTGVPFVVNTHGIFTFYLTTGNPYFFQMSDIYSLCDAVVALSRVDRAFWSVFAHRVCYLPNPLPSSLSPLRDAPRETRNVLWVGRLAPDKNPVDAVRTFEKVLRCVPDARLLMLGTGDHPATRAQIEQELDRAGIRDRVVLCGFQTDVERYYREASVVLCTSPSEGFPLWLVEAKAHGRPCVMYELPYLELVRDSRGVASVPLGDVSGAAEKIVELLQNNELRKRMGHEARQSIDESARFDLAAGWRTVLEAAAAGGERMPRVADDEETLRILLKTFFEHSRLGQQKHDAVRQERDQLRRGQDHAREEEARLRRALADARQAAILVRHSWSFRLGSALLFMPGKIRTWWKRGARSP